MVASEVGGTLMAAGGWLAFAAVLARYVLREGIHMQGRVTRSHPCPCRGCERAEAVWCAYCYENVRGRANHRGHRGHRAKPSPYVPAERYTIMKKPEQVRPNPTAGEGWSDTTFASKYPHVTEYLTHTTYDDGSARETSNLSVSCQDGWVGLGLNDKDLKQSTYTRAETLQEALKLLETALKAGTVTWRPWGGRRKK